VDIDGVLPKSAKPKTSILLVLVLLLEKILHKSRDDEHEK
jgi:hypothetical protein